MADQITEQFADRRRIERAEIIGLVWNTSLESGTCRLRTVEHRNELVRVPARADHRHRQIVINQLEQLFQNAETARSNDKTRTKQGDIHALLAPFNGEFFGFQF